MRRDATWRVNQQDKGKDEMMGDRSIPIGEFPIPITDAEHRIITWLNDNPDNEGGLTRRMIHELYVSAENIFCRFCEAWGHRKGECHMMRRGEKRGRRMRRKKMTPEELPRY